MATERPDMAVVTDPQRLAALAAVAAVCVALVGYESTRALS